MFIDLIDGQNERFQTTKIDTWKINCDTKLWKNNIKIKYIQNSMW